MLTGSWVNLGSGLFRRRRLGPSSHRIFRDDQLTVLLDELDLGILAVWIDVEDAGLSWCLMWHRNILVLVLWARRPGAQAEIKSCPVDTIARSDSSRHGFRTRTTTYDCTRESGFRHAPPVVEQ